MSSDSLVFFMHGKWSRPNTYIFKALEKLLISKNYTVKKLDMPWGKYRNYDQSYDDALHELKTKIEEHQRAGFKKIILIGHSLGANACFAYQSKYNDADAIIAIAPGHRPEHLFGNNQYQQWLRIAKRNIDTGQGEQLISFEDINSGYKKTFNIMSKVFYSYYCPTGLGNMTSAVSKIKKSVPVLYIEARTDTVRLGPEYVFFRLPKNSYNSYKLVESNHIDCVKASKNLIMEWLKDLKIDTL